jgi:hypothetical protein
MLHSIRQQSKYGHPHITGKQIGKRHRPSREQSLAPFFQTNQDGQEQADGQDEASEIPFWEQSHGTFIQQKAQDTEQDEMSHFIPTGEFIEPSYKIGKLVCIRNNDNRDDQQEKEQGPKQQPSLHKKIETP